MTGPGEDGSETGLSPTTARLRMGLTLRSLREQVGMTLDEAAQALQRSGPTVSRLENGKVSKPREIDVVTLLDAYARRRPSLVTEQARRELLSLVYNARQDVWFNKFRDVLAGEMVTEDARRYIELENDAVRVESYELELMTGLLQTRSYIESIANTYYPQASAEQRERFVEFRMARKTHLRKAPPLELHVIFSELALVRAPGGPAVQREQLEALRRYIGDGPSNVRIQVAPLQLSIPAIIGGPFVVMSFAPEGPDDLIYLEGREGAIYQQSPEVLARYRRNFTELTAAAHGPQASLKALEEAIAGLDKPR
jgi:transcriptional regulator with XRE-family HTH domain